MKQRIFRGMCGVTLLCVLLACVCITGVLYQFSFDSMRTMIRDETVYIVASLNNGDRSALEATRATFTRITLINPDGSVAFDSLEPDPSRMENHASRPEVAEALKNGASETQRFSTTLAESTYYRAIRLQNGQVVRISGTMDSVWMAILRYLPALMLILGVAVIISALAARRLAIRFAAPLNCINLDQPLDNDVYAELSPLLRRLEQQRLEIADQLAQMERQQREFGAIISGMREGLILLSKQAEVLSINTSALAALSLPDTTAPGTHILNICRAEALQTAVQRSLDGQSVETALSLNGREYQLLANPVADEGTVKGAVLLLLDVTEKAQAEQIRREFTANVSHELKTPLTSISGFAELIKDGMVQPEDIPAFAGRIYDEARRLIALVEDIIRLSRLDERSDTAPWSCVNLHALALEAAQRLAAQAQQAQVEIHVSGSDATVSGVPHILEEIVYNLCDNAVKYNHPGGRVEVVTAQTDDQVILTVSDTGIGIPAEHQARVFERFYRVDKSHSKETGGTGLGLSIVKHGAYFHGALLDLKSEPGTGTAITITFPKTAAPRA